MKLEVTKAQSLHNYNIKNKHAEAMNNFLQSKHFQVTTRMPTPPKRDPPKKGEKAEAKSPTKAGRGNDKKRKGSAGAQSPGRGGKKGKTSKEKEQPEDSVDQKKVSISSIDSELAKNFVCNENIEKDEVELAR